MSLLEKLRKTPPEQWPKKALRRLKNTARSALAPCFRFPLNFEKEENRIETLLPVGWAPPGGEVFVDEGDIQDLLRHRLELLGKRVNVNAWESSLKKRLQEIPRRFRSEALRRLKGLQPSYVFIDWQRDFKSGFRWSASTPMERLRWGNHPGADIKVPWELARLQHLPRLAWAYRVWSEKEEKPGTCEALLREFQNQVRDFSAFNPLGFGAAWGCTMDSAIRLANLCLAFDFFHAAGATFDKSFSKLFSAVVREHLLFVRRHLEWDPFLRANHYLVDLAGLAVGAAHWKEETLSRPILEFCAAELSREVVLQFHPEGSNFEASTSYHRLSAESAAFAFAALAKRGYASSVSPEALERLNNAAAFTRAVLRPDGKIVQIGDNDSGRFYKLNAQEAVLDHRGLSVLLGTLLGRKKEISGYLEAEILRTWKNTAPWKRAPAQDKNDWPQFGLYRKTAGAFCVWIRLGDIGQKGRGGHAHNDQLSLEIVWAGEPWVVDPGTYLYTPSPKWRNVFRSTAAHNTLQWGDREQNPWEEGEIFALRRRVEGKVLENSPKAFTGILRSSEGEEHRRSLRMSRSGIFVEDSCPQAGEKTVRWILDPGVRVKKTKKGFFLFRGKKRLKLQVSSERFAAKTFWYSPAYGEKQKTFVLEARTMKRRLFWSLTPA